MTNSNMSDRKLLLILLSTMVVILVAVSLLAHTSDESDTRPTTYNAGSAGAKAAYLTLEALGRKVDRWNRPLNRLGTIDAANTTLVLANPKIDVLRRQEEMEDLRRFLERGGRVLMTGREWASLLPGGRTVAPGFLQSDLCFTNPEGPGELAAAGKVEMVDAGGWAASEPEFRVEQRCGRDAVVVRFPVGKGEAIWWSSPTPLSNAGLKKDANMKLLLASLYGDGGEGRQVLFDEYVQDLHSNDSVVRGLPLWWLLAQFVLVFVLLVLSFSRRKGPLRLPVSLPRSSPVEFAMSMGDLYGKADATNAATDAAKRRLLKTLQREAGVSRAAVEHGPDAVADSLRIRLQGDWNSMAQHLREADEASQEPLQPRSALALVRGLREDEERVRAAIRPAVAVKIKEDLVGSTTKE